MVAGRVQIGGIASLDVSRPGLASQLRIDAKRNHLSPQGLPVRNAVNRKTNDRPQLLEIPILSLHMATLSSLQPNPNRWDLSL